MSAPNFGYHFARLYGASVRRAYSMALPAITRRRVCTGRSLDFTVFAYSGEATLPEQVASIRSFLRYAGRPRAFSVVSDGTHSTRSIDRLRRVDSCVRVLPIDDIPVPEAADSVRSYLSSHATGRQLRLIMSLPMGGPTLYIDSDVLFFDGAAEIAASLSDENAPASYLPDCRLSADERLFRSDAERTQPVNTGVLFLRQRLDWSAALERMPELNGDANFFTNQTLTHLAMHANGATPLDPARFVLQLDDQFVYSDRYARDAIILRHYVNPVRHKFWMNVL